MAFLASDGVAKAAMARLPQRFYLTVVGINGKKN
jgi:hypothetical protein